MFSNSFETQEMYLSKTFDNIHTVMSLFYAAIQQEAGKTRLNS